MSRVTLPNPLTLNTVVCVGPGGFVFPGVLEPRPLVYPTGVPVPDPYSSTVRRSLVSGLALGRLHNPPASLGDSFGVVDSRRRTLR